MKDFLGMVTFIMGALCFAMFLITRALFGP